MRKTDLMTTQVGMPDYHKKKPAKKKWLLSIIGGMLFTAALLFARTGFTPVYTVRNEKARNCGLAIDGLVEPQLLALPRANAFFSQQMVFSQQVDPGTESFAVNAVQRRLIDLGFLEIEEPTGYYGEETEQAIRTFQRVQGLEETGVATSETLRILFDRRTETHRIALGDEGEEVKNITKRLHLLGYGVTPWLTYTQEVQLAVKSFQGLNDLEVSGEVNYETALQLFAEEAVCADGTEAAHSYLCEEERNEKVANLLAVAHEKLGCPYARGSKGPGRFDCSGFVYYCLRAVGCELSYMTSAGWRDSDYPHIADMKDLLPGDICTFEGHVGIYVGDGVMIDASSSEDAIRLTDDIRKSGYWCQRWDGGRRVL